MEIKLRKTTQSYRMPSEVKVRAAGIINSHDRGDFKRIMISADVIAQEAKEKAKFKKESVSSEE